MKLLLAEDENMFRKTLSLMLSQYFEITEAENGKEAVELFRENTFDLSIVDLQMPVMNGIEAISMMREISKDAKIIVLTSHTESHLLRAVYPLVNNILLKSYSPFDFIDVVNDTLAGKDMLSKEVADMVLKKTETDLTPTEFKVLKAISEGLTDQAIADKFYNSVHTIRQHTQKIYRKFNCNRKQLIIKANSGEIVL